MFENLPSIKPPVTVKKTSPLMRFHAHLSWERWVTFSLIVGVDVKGRQQHILNARGVGIVLAVALV